MKALLSRENEWRGKSVFLHSGVKGVDYSWSTGLRERGERAEATSCRALWAGKGPFYGSAQASPQAHVSSKQPLFFLDCRPPGFCRLYSLRKLSLPTFSPASGR